MSKNELPRYKFDDSKETHRVGVKKNKFTAQRDPKDDVKVFDTATGWPSEDYKKDEERIEDDSPSYEGEPWFTSKSFNDPETNKRPLHPVKDYFHPHDPHTGDDHLEMGIGNYYPEYKLPFEDNPNTDNVNYNKKGKLNLPKKGGEHLRSTVNEENARHKHIYNINKTENIMGNLNEQIDRIKQMILFKEGMSYKDVKYLTEADKEGTENGGEMEVAIGGAVAKSAAGASKDATLSVDGGGMEIADSDKGMDMSLKSAEVSSDVEGADIGGIDIAKGERIADVGLGADEIEAFSVIDDSGEKITDLKGGDEDLEDMLSVEKLEDVEDIELDVWSDGLADDEILAVQAIRDEKKEMPQDNFPDEEEISDVEEEEFGDISGEEEEFVPGGVLKNGEINLVPDSPLFNDAGDYVGEAGDIPDILLNQGDRPLPVDGIPVMVDPDSPFFNDAGELIGGDGEVGEFVPHGDLKPAEAGGVKPVSLLQDMLRADIMELQSLMIEYLEYEGSSPSDDEYQHMAAKVKMKKEAMEASNEDYIDDRIPMEDPKGEKEDEPVKKLKSKTKARPTVSKLSDLGRGSFESPLGMVGTSGKFSGRGAKTMGPFNQDPWADQGKVDPTRWKDNKYDKEKDEKKKKKKLAESRRARAYRNRRIHESRPSSQRNIIKLKEADLYNIIDKVIAEKRNGKSNTIKEYWMQNVSKEIKKDHTGGSFRNWCEKHGFDSGCSDECIHAALKTDDTLLHYRAGLAKAFCGADHHRNESRRPRQTLQEKWKGDVKIKKLDKWGEAEISYTKLCAKGKALSCKDDKTSKESTELKQIQFALRSREKGKAFKGVPKKCKCDK